MLRFTRSEYSHLRKTGFEKSGNSVNLGTDAGLRGWFVRVPRDLEDSTLSSGVFNNWNKSVLHGIIPGFKLLSY